MHNEVVVTLGRLATGEETTVSIPAMASAESRGLIEGVAEVSSSTALPVFTNAVKIIVIH